MRYKNWKLYYYDGGPAEPTGWFMPLIPYHWTLIANIKRDPFEQTVGFGRRKVGHGVGRRAGSPSTAYIYDWNMLPIGQQLWEEELESYEMFPPLQAPETYNLSGILTGNESP